MMISNSEVPNMEIAPRKTQIDYSKLEKSKVLFHKGTNTRHVFHYTSIGGLQGILENKKIRFTNIRYMNDKEENLAGLESMLKASNISGEKADNLRTAFQDEERQTFVCCFSIEEDSLPMWNYYTKDANSQGYNIEFLDKKLVESILRENPALDGCDISFGIVDYSKDNDSKYGRTIIDSWSNSMSYSISELLLTIGKMVGKDLLSEGENADLEWSLQELKKRIADEEKKLTALPIYFFDGESCNFSKGGIKGGINDYLCYIKRECFKQEQEFRIVITVPNERMETLKEKGVYKFRSGNGILIPFLELAFSTEAVKGIMISPTIQSDLVELSIREFLKYCNFSVEDYSQFIRHSKVPVRF